jgi:hypothetical protein
MSTSDKSMYLQNRYSSSATVLVPPRDARPVLAAAQEVVSAPSNQLSDQAQLFRMVAGSLGGFAALWLFFYFLFLAFPYISSGSDIVYRAKLRLEQNGEVFPKGLRAQRILAFGDSRILAGFIPDQFDAFARHDSRDTYSFNSGFPARGTFVPQLKTMADRGQAPDLVLLTLPWQEAKGGFDPFDVAGNDHELVERLFPFRYFVRDLASFLLASPAHGGPVDFYDLSRRSVDRMMESRGYYFITEQSRFAGESLPDNFHLDTDKPGVVDPSREKSALGSAELQQLRETVTQHHISCYYVPYYLRQGAYAQPPPHDDQFARLIEQRLPCEVLGPRYFVYPPDVFSDPVHLNPRGAHIYTEALYQLLSDHWPRPR